MLIRNLFDRIIFGKFGSSVMYSIPGDWTDKRMAREMDTSTIERSFTCNFCEEMLFQDRNCSRQVQVHHPSFALLTHFLSFSDVVAQRRAADMESCSLTVTSRCFPAVSADGGRDAYGGGAPAIRAHDFSSLSTYKEPSCA